MPNRPPRLERLHEEYQNPVWFVTFTTHRRLKLLANELIHERFRLFCKGAAKRGVFVGRYVIMPDHAHLFVAAEPGFDPKLWVRSFKLSLSKPISTPRPHWQQGSFDHLLRHEESFAEKWEYVRQNPVRAKLVTTPENWPFQGEIHELRLT